MITSYERGHLVYIKDSKIFYRDNDEEVDWNNPRPCPRCGRPPTPEGHDACLGTLPGVKSACCGHGITEAIVVKEEGMSEEFHRKHLLEFCEEQSKGAPMPDEKEVAALAEKLFREAVDEEFYENCKDQPFVMPVMLPGKWQALARVALAHVEEREKDSEEETAQIETAYLKELPDPGTAVVIAIAGVFAVVFITAAILYFIR